MSHVTPALSSQVLVEMEHLFKKMKTSLELLRISNEDSAVLSDKLANGDIFQRLAALAFKNCLPKSN